MPISPPIHKPQRNKAKAHTTQLDRWGQGRGGSKWRARREQVFKRDGYLCQPCKSNNRLTPVQLHGPRHGVCGHIIPIAEGGGDDMNNLQTECQACDRAKTIIDSRRGKGG